MCRHAPHLIDAEVGNVLRRHEQSNRISSPKTVAALRAGRALIEHRYPHAGPLAEPAWTWQADVGFYDAPYLTLAARLGVPLMTADVRLSTIPHPPR